MKKKVGIILVILIIIAIGITVGKKIGTSKYDYNIKKVEEYNYFVCCENNEYGVIDKEGKEIIETKYKEIIIPNPQYDVFICNDGEKEFAVNSKGEQLFKQYDSVQAIKLKNIASALNYEKDTLMYEKNEKYGIMNLDGKEITKNIYDSIENLQPTEGKFIVTQDKKCGVIDLKGNQLVEIKYDKITSDGYYTEDDGYKKSGFIVSNTENDGYKYGYINYKGKKQLDVKYNDINRISREDSENVYLIASQDGKYGLYKNSKNIIKNEYQSINYDEEEEILIIQKNKKYGVANLEGKTIIDIKNNQVEVKGIYIYTEDKVYDNKGNEVNINYDKAIYKTANEDYMITTKKEDDTVYYGIMNKDEVQLVDEEYSYIEYLFSNYFIATNKEGKLGVINSNGKTMLDMEYDSLQKIKGTNIIQAIKSNGNEFYSKDLTKIDELQNVNIQVQEDYVKIEGKDKTLYLDFDGKTISNSENLKTTGFPEKVGDYIKQQISIENVYYVKD